MYNKKVKEILRKLEINDLSELDLTSIIYVAYLIKETNRSLDDIKDLDLKFQTKLIYSKYENEIKQLSSLLSTDDLKNLLMNNDNIVKDSFKYSVLKDGVYKLLIDLLEVEEEDSVGDFQLSSFSKFDYIIERKNYDKIDIYEPDMQKILIYKMKNDILKGNARIIESNVAKENIDEKYNKIIAPIRLQVPLLDEQVSILNKAYPKLRNISKRSDGWADILNALLYLEDGGKLVTLAVPSIMYSIKEKNIRKYFVENGLIESVITLPENILRGTGIGSTILVISKNNSSINFIDARDIYVSINRFERELSKKDRESILELIGKDTTHSIVSSVEEVIAKDYILDPKRYLNNIVFKREVLLGDVVKRVDRGSNITNKEMERYKTEKKTKYRFLNLVDIQDGRIQDTALSLKESLVESNEKLIQANKLEKGQLILSRTGNPIRIAIVEDIENEVWFYSGNIYSISLDLDKYNPYYLKIFLESEIGQEMLQQIALGSVIPNISMKDLKGIKLPDIEIEEQNRVADLYLNYEEKIKDKERELKILKLNRQRDLADILSREEVGLCD